MTNGTKVVKGRIFRVYFESLYADPIDTQATHTCAVIAENAEEAFAKIKVAFPQGKVNSISSDTSYMGSKPALDSIVI